MLLIDAGNSRIKWVSTQVGAWARRGTHDYAAWDALRAAFTALPAPRRILISNVAGAEVAQQLRTACAAWQCTPEFIHAQAQQCGVRNTYLQPAQLGSDRWAALIAAWHEVHAACLVVNCGTATTVDALSDAGEFIGGLILPGLDMMRGSLAAGTAQLGAARGTWQDFPRTTADAVESGVLRATVCAIRSQFEALRAPHARCVLGGGAAGSVEAHLALPLLRADDLVLLGLQLIARDKA